MLEQVIERAEWVIEKFAVGVDPRALESRPFEVSRFEGNCLLNEGINDIWAKVVGTAGTAFNNANSYLGVGDSATAAGPTQTGLQAVTNKLYKAMEATYPTTPPVTQCVVFRSVFASADANFAWNEFTVANGNSDAGINLNRKVSAQGTKVTGQSWTLTLTITLA